MDITCFASIYGLREKLNVWHGELGRVASDVNFNSWHKEDLRPAAPERRLTSAFQTLGAECLLSGEDPTVFLRALKVGS
jgi:hypothetical protein